MLFNNHTISHAIHDPVQFFGLHSQAGYTSHHHYIAPSTYPGPTLMRSSQFHFSTTKEVPADADVISHQLMFRAGMVRRVASGLYNWMPLGLRVLRKVEAIVREEMNESGGVELLMPAVHPAELWQESGRWQKYGPELLRLQDRHNRDFCVGPTHEEVITDIARRELRSYKQLPVNFYQIQTKFRDEIRPRFGVIRSREFIMKDAYSFHISSESLSEMFDHMHSTYCKIFDRIGLQYRGVEADSGSIGGAKSREFHVLADSGEDALAYASAGDYAANVEKAEAIATGSRAEASQMMSTVDTPDAHTMQSLAAFLNIDIQDTLKTLLVHAEDDGLVALVLRGDHTLNEIKAANIEGVADPLTFATHQEVKNVTGCSPGSIGPVGLSISIIADRAASVLSNFVCGANQDDKHLIGVNWHRDLAEPTVADLRNVVDGDPNPNGEGTLQIIRGIEVGHIFELGDTYSQAMQAKVLDKNGKSVVLQMGCYGIGIGRIVAAAIEQNNDEKGILWPAAIAPFQVVISPIHMQKSPDVETAATELYQQLKQAGVDVLLDDRVARPGVMFAEMELIGIPHRLVLSERGLGEGTVEYKGRQDTDSTNIERDQVVETILNKLSSH